MGNLIDVEKTSKFSKYWTPCFFISAKEKTHLGTTVEGEAPQELYGMQNEIFK